MPLFDRRRLLAGGGSAAALALATGSWSASASPSAPSETQNAGWFRFNLGEMKITVVSDGHLQTPTSLLGVNADRAEVDALLKRDFLDAEQNYAHTNHVIADVGEARVLVDVGSGDKFQPTAGRLLANLEAAEIDPGSITHVALTHAHPDHVWGMMDDFGDLPRIPNAAYAIGEAEYAWWTAADRIASVPEAMQAMVVGAQNALKPVAEKTSFVKDGAEIVPGVRLLAAPGHTAGHMCVMLESGSEKLLVTGDAITHTSISFEQPDWHFGFDFDPAMAARSRKRLLDMAATDRIPLLGFHFPFPGLGHVARQGDAYRYIPALWRWNG